MAKTYRNRFVLEKYNSYTRVFSKTESKKLPPYRLGLDYEIVIKLGFKLLYRLIYNLSKDELRHFRKYIKKIEGLGFIRKSESEIALLIIFVVKKDRKPRLVINFYVINVITVLNRYPIPLISKILNRLGLAKIFTKLDLRSTYNLIRIKKGYEYLIAFRTRHGLYEYLVIPFRLYNALVTF